MAQRFAPGRLVVAIPGILAVLLGLFVYHNRGSNNLQSGISSNKKNPHENQQLQAITPLRVTSLPNTGQENVSPGINVAPHWRAARQLPKDNSPTFGLGITSGNGQGLPTTRQPNKEALRRLLVSSRENLLKERGGIYGYNTSRFGMTFDRGEVEFGTYKGIEGTNTAYLRYGLEEVRVGTTAIAKGGRVSPKTRLEERTIYYDRGNVEERYILTPEGPEQVFVISALPEGRGEITLTGAVDTNLQTPEDGTTSGKLSFTYKGEEEISLSQAVAIDASGKRLPLGISYAEGKLSLCVPANWVEQATLPITVDPLFGGPTTYDSDAFFYNLEVTHNPTNNEWMIVWSDYFGSSGNADILAQRVAADNTPIGTEILIAGGGLGLEVSVSFAPAPINKYLVAWGKQGADFWFDLVGRLLNTDGTFATSEFVIDDPGTNNDDRAPFIAFDGTNWFVTYWSNIGATGDRNIKGRFVSTAGVPGTRADPDVSTETVGAGAKVEFTSSTYMIAWFKAPFIGSTDWSLMARTMNTSGTFLTSATTIASATNLTGGWLSAGNAKFLLTWAEPSTFLYKGRVANTSLGFDTAVFTISSGTVAHAGVTAYSSTNSEWLVVHGDPNGVLDLWARRVTPTGSVSAAEPITGTVNNSEASWRLSWNSTSNNMLLVYFLDPSPYNLVAQRYSMNPPPAIPTGLAVTGVGDGSVSLSWNAVTAATSYQVKRAEISGGPYTVVGQPTGTSFTDISVINATPYFYVVSAENDGGESGNSAQVSATPIAPALNGLFVVGNTNLNAGDSAVKTRLESIGYVVVVKKDSASVTADANGKAIVLISSTVNPGNVGTKFRDVLIPVIVWEHDLYDDMWMTGAPTTEHGSQTGQTQLVIQDPTHPMAAGLTGTKSVVTASRTFTWGKPNTNAARIATLVADATKWVIFGYEKNAVMPGGTAAARRVGFFLHDTTAGVLNTDGKALFDAAIRWAANAPASPITVSIQITGTEATLKWEAVDGALSYRVLRSTTSGGPYTVVASGLTYPSFVNTGLSIGTTYYYSIVAVNSTSFSAGSSQVSTQAANAVAVASIIGPRFLWNRRTGVPVSDWNRGTYEVRVARFVGGVRQVPTPGFTNTWTVIGPDAGTVTVTSPNMTSPALSVEANTDLPVGAIRTPQLRCAVTLSTGETTTETVRITLWDRIHVSVSFRFPENDPGRTQRDPSFFGGTQFTRGNARQAFANTFLPQVDVYLRQAGIKTYFQLDDTEGLTIDAGGVPNGDFVAGAINGAPTQAFRNLKRSNRFFQINVYLVRQVNDGGVLIGGITLDPRVVGSRLTVALSDEYAGQPNRSGQPVVLAHEILHALSLLDMEDLVANRDAIDGPLNDQTLTLWNPGGWPTAPWTPAFMELLMWSEGRTNTLMTFNHGFEARQEGQYNPQGPFKQVD